MTEIGLSREDDVRAACRAVLVTHPADRARFEEAFDLFWSLLRGARPAGTDAVQRRRGGTEEAWSIASDTPEGTHRRGATTPPTLRGAPPSSGTPRRPD